MVHSIHEPKLSLEERFQGVAEFLALGVIREISQETDKRIDTTIDITNDKTDAQDQRRAAA